MKSIFFDLPKPELTNASEAFSLVPRVYEREIAQRNGGLGLGDKLHIQSLDESHLRPYKEYVPLYSNGKWDSGLPLDAVKDILPRNKDIQAPCSLAVPDMNDLFEHALHTCFTCISDIIRPLCLGNK